MRVESERLPDLQCQGAGIDNAAWLASGAELGRSGLSGVTLMAGAVSGGVGTALSTAAAAVPVRAGTSAFWSNAASQQLNRAVGRQDEFDWRGLMSSTLAASASVGTSRYQDSTELGRSLGGATTHAAGNLPGGSIGQRLLRELAASIGALDRHSCRIDDTSAVHSDHQRRGPGR